MEPDLTLGRFYAVDVLFRGDLLEFCGICEEYGSSTVILRPPPPRGADYATAVVIDTAQIVRITEL